MRGQDTTLSGALVSRPLTGRLGHPYPWGGDLRLPSTFVIALQGDVALKGGESWRQASKVGGPQVANVTQVWYRYVTKNTFVIEAASVKHFNHETQP